MRLAELRRERGMSLALLAGMARVSPGLLSYAEKGRYQLSSGQARKLADVLHVEPADVEELRDAVDVGQTGTLPEGLHGARAAATVE